MNSPVRASQQRALPRLTPEVAEVPRTSSSPWQVLVDNAPIGICLVDANFHIEQINSVARQIFGNIPDLIGCDFGEVLRMVWPREYADELACQFRHTLETGEPYIALEQISDSCDQPMSESYEWQISRLPLPDGRYGLACYFRDISKQVAARRVAHEQQQQLEAHIKNSPLAIVEWDSHYKVTRWEGEAERIFGWSAGECLGKCIADLDLVFEEDRQKVQQVMVRLGSGERHVFSSNRNKTKDGGVIDCEWYNSVLTDTQGRMYSVLSQVLDVTERKRTEASLCELNISLEQRVNERTAQVQRQTAQLRALTSELTQVEQQERKRLATILHDHIQQLLVAATLQLDLVKRFVTDVRPQSFLRGVDSTLKEAIQASRSLTVELSPPALQAGLMGGLRWLANRYEEKSCFKVHLKLDSKAEPASEDIRYLLFECIREILLNAQKHSGVKKASLAMLVPKEGGTQIIIEDKGKGFDPATLQNQNPADMSFGLFSIQQRLAHLGGHLLIETAPGQGACFTLWIPPLKSEKNEAAPTTAVAADLTSYPITVQPRRAQIRVLLVDDHRIMREGLAGLLRFESDIEVVGEAGDGEQAIQLAHRLHPDVVLMDVGLPKLSGVEATKRMVQELSEIKIIGLSMYEESDVARSMIEAGAIAYRTKGGPSHELIAAIRSCRVGHSIEPPR